MTETKGASALFHDRRFLFATSLGGLLGSVGYPNPDSDDGPDPNGPLGPYIREILIASAVSTLVGQLKQSNLSRQFQSLSVQLITEQAARMSDASKR